MCQKYLLLAAHNVLTTQLPDIPYQQVETRIAGPTAYWGSLLSLGTIPLFLTGEIWSIINDNFHNDVNF